MPEILFPPGRMIGGNIDKLSPRTETNGTPKIGNDGKPEMQCSIGYAIPKTQARWQDEFYDHPVFGRIAWGATIYQTGAQAHPNLVASPAFSWKITDGDSTLPNKKGKKPCEQTGYPGHWVLWFSQGWLPKRVNSDGSVELPEGAIKPGYYVQVYGSVAGNKLVPNGTPGVYLNPIAVALVGEGDPIASDVDTTAVGFGQAAPPPGARPVQAAAPQFAPQFAPTAGAPLGVAAAGAPLGVAAAGAPLGVAAPPAAPSAPPPAPRPAVLHTMTAKAGGAPYEAFIAQGWTDAQLIAEGFML